MFRNLPKVGGISIGHDIGRCSLSDDDDGIARGSVTEGGGDGEVEIRIRFGRGG